MRKLVEEVDELFEDPVTEVLETIRGPRKLMFGRSVPGGKFVGQFMEGYQRDPAAPGVQPPKQSVAMGRIVKIQRVTNLVPEVPQRNTVFRHGIVEMASVGKLA